MQSSDFEEYDFDPDLYTHNLEFLIDEYNKQAAEQEEVIRVGYILDRDCWNCKKHFPKLRYKICDNGYISYWCDGCY
jgi:hypothetical protein